MKVFAISDLHLSINNPKPMDIFGPIWENYIDKIFEDWKNKVSEDDIVLLAGDFSWAIKLENTKSDFDLVKDLPGKKIIIRGNHDYWWKSISSVRGVLPQDFYAIQNDSLTFGDYIICGTRGWVIPDNKSSEEDVKIYKRELIRLQLTLENATRLRKEGQKLICMLHYPPYNFKEEDSEFTSLLEKYKVDCVVYGHLHAYLKQHRVLDKNNIRYYLTSCDLVDNKLIEIYWLKILSKAIILISNTLTFK